MLQRILSGSRYLIMIAVIGSFLASVAVLAYGGVRSLGIIVEVFTHSTFTENGAKHLSIESIELIDVFFLGTVMYIIALSLYELFINEDLPMPSWLLVTNLDDLKDKLLGVIIVLLAVTFLANVVTWNGNINILELGIAVGVVLFALAYLTKSRASARRRFEKQPDETSVEKQPDETGTDKSTADEAEPSPAGPPASLQPGRH